LLNEWTGGQYSTYRVVLALCAGLNIGLHLSEIGPRIPWGREPALPAIFSVALTVVCLALALGWHDRWAALGLAAVGGFLVVLWGTVSAGTLILVGLLILHAATPPAPYGSLAAAGRVDPAGGWYLPRELFLGAWCGLWTVQLALGAVGLSAVLSTGPHGIALADAGRLLLLPLACFAWTRPFAWLGWLLLTLPMLVASGTLDRASALFALQALTFNPAWIRGAAGETETVFFDGHCGLCHRAVRFILAEDRAGTTFHFATLDSVALRSVTTEAERTSLPDSSVVRTTDGRLLVRSAGLLHILRRLGGLWRILGEVGRWVPRGVLDLGYDGIARVRKRLFPAPADACPMMSPEMRKRFVA
jgi:predicted DCC family thiol-disulfide oxidoreductase YuxK